MTVEQYRAMFVDKENAIPKNKYKNTCNNDRGHAFEQLILDGCTYYACDKRAVINKVYEPYRCLRILGDGKFLGQFTGRAEPDFKGVLCGGRAIAFEAKSTNKSRIQRNALTGEQMDWLEQQHQMGALAFVCVQISEEFFSVPWELWRDMKQKFGKKFLMPGDIRDYQVKFDGKLRFLDFITGNRLD